jgi:membrane protease YdiL (CAAX protease family)
MLNASSNSDGRSKIWRPKNKNVAQGFGNLWRVIGTTVLIFIVSQIFAAIIVELIFALIHGGSTPTNLLDQSAIAQFSYILLAEGGALWLVLKIIRRQGLKLAQIGLGRRPLGSDIIKGLLGFAVFFLFLIGVNGLLSFFFPEINNEKQDVGFNNLQSNLDQALALIALVILPPIGEETLVRGYLYSGLRASMRFLPAMIITSLLFGLAHLQLGSGTAVLWAAGIDTFVLSVILVYLRESTGALYAGMLVHAMNNLIAFGVHFH